MAARRVTGPDGARWTVRRTWVSRRLRWRGGRMRGLDLLDGADLAFAADDLPVIGVIGVVIGMIIFAVLAVVFVLPALVFILELLLIVALVGLGVAARVFFRRPWTIEASRDGVDDVYRWKVVGWQASNEAIDTVSSTLQATGQPAGGEPTSASSGN